MHTFTDRNKTQWEVSVTVDTIKRVRGLLDVDLLEVVGNEALLPKLIGDPILLCDVIYAVCKPQADEREITDEDFGRAMAGDAIDGATEALLEELTDFFPQPKRRLLRTALQKLKELQRMILQKAEARIESGELEKDLLRQLDAGGLSTTSPESSDSTPDH